MLEDELNASCRTMIVGLHAEVCFYSSLSLKITYKNGGTHTSINAILRILELSNPGEITDMENQQHELSTT
jgi:hypothetical protein